jgi:hypothetical protein
MYSSDRPMASSTYLLSYFENPRPKRIGVSHDLAIVVTCRDQAVRRSDAGFLCIQHEIRRHLRRVTAA